ncbi:MAG: HD domain-containing protein [Clostridiales bacterium]|nr:HD domain-containing protein [Clostridiales bacterium]
MKLKIKRDILFEHLSEPVFRTGLLEQLKEFNQHGSSNCYDHSVSVAKASLYIAMLLPFHFKMEQLVRGALLHDYFLYDWHVTKPEKLHGFSHPHTACRNAKRDFDITPLEENIIKRHMFPLTPVPPRFKESYLVTLADKYIATKEFFAALRQRLHPARALRLFSRSVPYVFSFMIVFLPWK